ncbi:unnamed protein product [Ceutorhynchus assimilis]|uniref:Uncharacterized protein n=1 Tax=Ceutorhynchus assimilis TaxID=467358 RepID=A0A9N9MJA6_9CUCU|nr:unnamed protein product [Ceutorhynchus assimilis]
MRQKGVIAMGNTELNDSRKKLFLITETPYGGDVSSGDEAEPSEQPRNDIEIVYEYAQDRESMDEDVIEEDLSVRALTSSEVSEKYNQLMDMRLEIADFTKKRLAQELDHSKDKHKKDMELLDLQVLVEKERLNKLKRPDY